MLAILSEIRDAHLAATVAALGMDEARLVVTLNDALRAHWEFHPYPGQFGVGVRSHENKLYTLAEVLSLYISGSRVDAIGRALLNDHNGDGFYNNGSMRNRTEACASLASFYNDLRRHVESSAPLESDGANYWCRSALDHARNLCDEQGLELIRVLQPNADFIFRARYVSNPNLMAEAWRNTAKELGAPPVESASASRLSAAWRPCFYGATSIQTCLPELRLESGWLVAIGRFTPTRPLQLLDLTVLPKLEYRDSMFSPGYEEKTQWVGLLRGLAQEISEPCWPGEHARTYRTTQYFAAYAIARSGWGLDGIVYPSPQSPAGANVAIFGGPELTVGETKLLEVAGDPIWHQIEAIRVESKAVVVPPPVDALRDPVSPWRPPNSVPIARPLKHPKNREENR